MSQATWAEYSLPVKLKVQAANLTDEQYALLCQENPELTLELTAQHELAMVPRTGSKTGWRNSRLTYHLVARADPNGTGLVFDSSTGFTPPHGAKRSLDSSVRRERWDALTEAQQYSFAPSCPDFVIELRSQPDRLAVIQKNAGIQ
jgi:Uma2 family endonuclease